MIKRRSRTAKVARPGVQLSMALDATTTVVPATGNKRDLLLAHGWEPVTGTWVKAEGQR